MLPIIPDYFVTNHPGLYPVFADERAILLDDPDHSADEDRFALLGLSGPLRVLVVAHCYREGESVVRIISARKATRTERAQYDAQS